MGDILAIRRPTCANRSVRLMPQLKDRLLQEFLDQSIITVQDFAKRCGLPRSTLGNALRGSDQRRNVVEAIAVGMGFLPQETSLLCLGNKKFSVSDLVAISLQRLGLGLWGVCDHNFVQTERFHALLQHWRGEHIQLLRGESGEERELTSVLDGRLCAVGRTVCGDFTLSANEPGFFVASVAMRVEGYWFGDNHFLAIYRFADTEMPNFGTVRATLSPCKSRLDGTCTGWNNPTNAWITAAFCLRRVDPSVDKNT